MIVLLVGSRQTEQVDLLPWAAGECSTLSWAMQPGNIPEQVTVVPGVQPGVLESAAAATIGPAGQLYIRIDTTGLLHAGEPLPADAPSCAAYPTYEP